MANGFGAIFFARIADRVGKGVRGAPRDALIADVTPPELRGAAFGLRQGLDTIGAFAGPLIAVALMSASNNDFNFVFWLAVIPAFLALATIFVGVKEPARSKHEQPRRNPITRANLRRLGGVFWWVVALGGLIAFARVGDAFLVLRASEANVPLEFIPLVLVAMNVIYSLTAYPFGKLADRFSASNLLILGVVLLIVASLVLAAKDGQQLSLLSLAIGLGIWGLHMAATQGLLAALIAKFAPADLRGTAFGMFNLISGGALLASGLATGLVWNSFGYSAAFLLSAVVATVTLVLLISKRSALSGTTGEDTASD
ncbi:MAG: MFS transporter [Micrococcales bacterium]